MGWTNIPNPPTLADWLVQNPQFVGYDPQDEFYTNPWYVDRRAGAFVPDDDDDDNDEEADEKAKDEDDNNEEADEEAEADGDGTVGAQVIEHLLGGEADAEGFPDSDYEADVQPS